MIRPGFFLTVTALVLLLAPTPRAVAQSARAPSGGDRVRLRLASGAAVFRNGRLEALVGSRRRDKVRVGTLAAFGIEEVILQDVGTGEQWGIPRSALERVEISVKRERLTIPGGAWVSDFPFRGGDEVCDPSGGVADSEPSSPSHQRLTPWTSYGRWSHD